MLNDKLNISNIKYDGDPVSDVTPWLPVAATWLINGTP